MSVYVSISCLGIDKELIHTVDSCLSEAEFPDQINIGIAFIGRKEFYEETVKYLSKYKNIKYKYVDLENNWGVGNGRLLATSMYDGEDYFMQIDAHTRFNKNWDTYLIDRFKKAQIHVNNQKVVLSGLPGYYNYINFDDDRPYPIKVDGPLRYIMWLPGEYMTEHEVMPRWTMVKPNEFSDDFYKNFKESGFAPLPKISAAFIFSNNIFAKNTHMSSKYLVFEEEMIQSSELISDGFTLIYPGEYCPIYHLYKQDIKNNKGFRESLEYPEKEGLLKNSYDLLDMAMNNYLQYYKYPKTRKNALRFEKYNNISFINGADDILTFPDQYANINYMPVGEHS